MDRQGLKEILQKYKHSFAKDSLDCGLTNIHKVRIPTNRNAPPTFVREYKIPIASYEPVQEIVDSMLEKGFVWPCKSTYSAPIWPVLKPNGKSATDSTPSHYAPSDMPTHQQNSKFSLTRHALTPEATLST